MKINAQEGFKRVRWVFLALCWGWYVLAGLSFGWNAFKWGEFGAYVFLFSCGCILAARCIIWIIRGFLGASPSARDVAN